MDLIFAKAHIEGQAGVPHREADAQTRTCRGSSRRLQRSVCSRCWRTQRRPASTSPGRISDSSAEAGSRRCRREQGEAPVAHPLLWQSQVKSRVEFTGCNATMHLVTD
ncbi:hypothetical protein L1887_55058 [Cichorium endivia]|nr:hypothetical protein L1887_55058 [Cichorium endivia]